MNPARLDPEHWDKASKVGREIVLRNAVRGGIATGIGWLGMLSANVNFSDVPREADIPSETPWKTQQRIEARWAAELERRSAQVERSTLRPTLAFEPVARKR